MVTIFLSSTSKDLKKHRKAVDESLRKAATEPIVMEYFNAQPGDAVEVSLAEVEKCELFVGIYAYRYGYQPDNEKSVTEMEYDHAVKLGKDCLLFMVDPSYRKGDLAKFADDGDPDKKQRLEDFKARVEETYVRGMFTTPDNLASNVTSAVMRWLQVKNKREKAAEPAKEAGNSTNITINGDVNRGIVGTEIKSQGNTNISFGDQK